jgi:hypothetical protein
MTARWWHIVGLLVIGYALGYWMPKLGDLTLARVYPRQ